MTPRRQAGSANAMGFTLLELLVVLALMALASAILFPSFRSSGNRAVLRTTAIEIQSALRRARAVAIRTNTARVVSFDLGGRRYWAPGDPAAKRIDGRVSVQMTSLQRDALADRVANVRFRPDGSSSGATMILTSGRDRIRIDVDWMTGHPRLRKVL